MLLICHIVGGSVRCEGSNVMGHTVDWSPVNGTTDFTLIITRTSNLVFSEANTLGRSQSTVPVDTRHEHRVRFKPRAFLP